MNGAAAGRTPVDVVVSRRAVDPSVRVQKEGFTTEQQRLERGFSGWLAVDVALSGLVAASGYFAAQESSGSLSGLGYHLFTAGSAGFGAAVVLLHTFKSGSAYAFRDRVDVVLKPVDNGTEAVDRVGARRLRLPLDGGKDKQFGLERGGQSRDEVQWRAWLRALRESSSGAPVTPRRERDRRLPVSGPPEGPSECSPPGPPLRGIGRRGRTRPQHPTPPKRLGCCQAASILGVALLVTTRICWHLLASGSPSYSTR